MFSKISSEFVTTEVDPKSRTVFLIRLDWHDKTRVCSVNWY